MIQIKFLEELDFTTHSYSKKQLNDDGFVQANPEAELATQIFGKGKNVGNASIGFDVINSKEWQDKKKEVIEKLKTRGISIDTNKENAKQVTEK